MTNAREIQTRFGMRYKPEIFVYLATAWRRALHEGNAKQCWTVVMGDCDAEYDRGEYWVVCFSDAARLVKAGYEIAPQI